MSMHKEEMKSGEGSVPQARLSASAPRKASHSHFPGRWAVAGEARPERERLPAAVALATERFVGQPVVRLLGRRPCPTNGSLAAALASLADLVAQGGGPLGGLLRKFGTNRLRPRLRDSPGEKIYPLPAERGLDEHLRPWLWLSVGLP